MPITWVELDEKDYTKLIKGLKEYKELERLIGPIYAAGSLKAMWNKFGSGGKSVYDKSKKDDYVAMMQLLLKHEMKTVLQAHYHIGGLVIKAQMKSFTADLATRLMADADYNAQTLTNDPDRAAQYIVHTSTSLRNTADQVNGPIKRADIKTALQAAAMYDVRSEVTLRDLHRRLVNQATLRPTRAMDLQAPYPSTGGAGWLLMRTFEMARGIPLPAANSPDWFDLACFLLGGVIRSHGFTDGNGRVGRAAYAAAMLKGTRPFVALKVEAEKLIHGLDQVA